MNRRTHPTTRERRRRERTVWGAALAISVVLHVLVFVLSPDRPLPPSPEAAAGPPSADVRAASGAMRATSLPEASAPARPSVPPPLPTPSLDPVEPPPVDDEASSIEGDLLGERPAVEPPGRDAGAGGGDGGTDEEGRYAAVPPSPRGMIFPPTDDRLRGREIDVWVFVDEEGRVVPDSTRLDPPTGDRDFDRRLRREAAEWVFEPAREGGEAVAAWFPYTIGM